MKINICNDNKIFPFLYVDDRYTPEEEKLIWKELDFYTNPYAMMRSEDDPNTGVFEDGNSKSRGWRIHVNEMYSGLIRDKDGKEYPLLLEFLVILQKHHYNHRYFREHSQTIHLI